MPESEVRDRVREGRGPVRSQTIVEAEDILNRALDAVRHHCECGGRKDDPDMIACYDCLDLDKNGEPPSTGKTGTSTTP